MKAVVRPLCAVFFALSILLPAAHVHAQVTATAPIAEYPQYLNRWDFSGGFQYSHFNPSAARNFPANNLLGWNGGAAVYFRPVWGIESNVRGLYGNIDAPQNSFGITNPRMSEYLFLFGPTFRLRRRENYAVGFHFLVGAAYGSFDKDFPPGISPNLIGVYNNKLAFGTAFGAWYDYNLSSKLAVRLTGDYQPTHYGFSTQNEFAAGVSVVYKVGALHK